MNANIIIGIAFVILAVSLFLVSAKGALGNGWLDKADKIASVLALLVAIVAFINPFDRTASQPQQSIFIGDNSSGNTVGGGNVTIGDTSTSAEKRFQAAFVRTKAEVLRNFSTLALLRHSQVKPHDVQ